MVKYCQPTDILIVVVFFFLPIGPCSGQWYPKGRLYLISAVRVDRHNSCSCSFYIHSYIQNQMPYYGYSGIKADFFKKSENNFDITDEISFGDFTSRNSLNSLLEVFETRQCTGYEYELSLSYHQRLLQLAYIFVKLLVLLKSEFKFFREHFVLAQPLVLADFNLKAVSRAVVASVGMLECTACHIVGKSSTTES